MVQAEAIESRFIFRSRPENISLISDGDGQQLGFSKNSIGNNVIFTKDIEGIDVAIEHCPDGTKIFHMEKDSKGLPAMHEFRPDGTEFIYLFDTTKRLEKMVEMRHNADKITTWFSENGERISQEQRQKEGILFAMHTNNQCALIWLHADGSVETYGNTQLINHLNLVFAKYLDGIKL
jgi:hypothetical protein